MNDQVVRAIEEIRETFPAKECVVEEDGDGGAFVIVGDVDLGPLYTPAASWVGFRITFQYPHADVYPHFVRCDLRRSDGKPLGEAIQGGQTFQGRPALMLSRRSTRLNPNTDTAALKLLKVVRWLSTRP